MCRLFNECENSPGHTDVLVNVTESFCYYTAKCYLSESVVDTDGTGGGEQWHIVSMAHRLTDPGSVMIIKVDC